MFAVCAGIVKLVRTSADGRNVIVGVRRRDSLLGAGAALLGAPEALTVIAITPCDLVEVPAARFASLVMQGGAVSRRVHLEHCLELDREVGQAAGLASLAPRERLEQFLRLLVDEVSPGEPNGHVTGVDLPLRDREVAQLLAITPQDLFRLMRELAIEGRLIRQGRRRLYVRS